MEKTDSALIDRLSYIFEAPMPLPVSFFVIGIGEHTSEAIARLKEWSAAFDDSESFSFCHIDAEPEVATLSLDNSKMAVLLFEANDKEQTRIAKEIASKAKKLVVGIASGKGEIAELDSVAYISGDDESLTNQWINATKVVLHPMLVYCVLSVDYNDLRGILAQSGKFLTYAGGKHDSIAEAVEELTADEDRATILRAKRHLFSVHTTSAMIWTIDAEMIAPIAGYIENMQAADEACTWGVYEHKEATDGKFWIEIIAADL